MQLKFIAVFHESNLVGGAIIQILHFKKHNSFNPKQTAFCSVRNFVINRLSSKVIILGNNMLSGENSFSFTSGIISEEAQFQYIISIFNSEFQKDSSQKLSVIKDFYQEEFHSLQFISSLNYTKFQVQPEMILPIQWKDFREYENQMTKKYRARIRTAQNKLKGIEKKELGVEDLINFQEPLYQLYLNVSKNAPLNTFYLPPNHFVELKKNLGNAFKIFAYFLDNKPMGFFTLIENFSELDTYFLGYESSIQKEKQLYLNMLLDMVQFGIENKFQQINFGRTALEIKSSIGAVPVSLYGLMKHRNSIINKFVEPLLKRIEPTPTIIYRHPFKN